LKVTTVYVTHDQIEAMTLADRVVVMNAGEIMQVGTPEDVYNMPANLFVAGFIGSPAMNLVEGSISNGVFEASNIRIEGIASSHSGPATLGYRAEDATIGGAPGSDQIKAPVYSVELLGDATMITVKAGSNLISAKADKDFRADIGSDIVIGIDPSLVHLFDTGSGRRL